MNYIYDIFLNFNDNLYDFFDWNTDDNIIHIKKIPYFKIKSKVMRDFINNNIKIDNSFLDKIQDKTEIFSDNRIKTIKYACLFSDDNMVIGVKFNKNGYLKKYSSLLIDEEFEILELVSVMKINILEYSILNKINVNNYFYTRQEQSIRESIEKELDDIIKSKSYDKLKYLYYECFNKSDNNIDKIYNDMKYALFNSQNNIIKKLNNILKITRRKNDIKT